MGIHNPFTRKQLIEQQVQSMRDYVSSLYLSRWPWVNRNAVINRIATCANQVDRAHAHIIKRERECDK